jgi:hypothetical protein
LSFASASLHRGKELSDFSFQFSKLDGQDGLPGMQDQVQRPGEFAQVTPHRGAHAPANAVPFHGAAQDLAHGKTHARSTGASAFAIKSNHVSGKMLSALLINRLKVRMLQQS